MLYRLLLSSSALLSVVFVSSAMPVKEGNALVAKSVFAMDDMREGGPELKDLVAEDCADCLEMTSGGERPSGCAEATGYLTACGSPQRGYPPACSQKDVDTVMMVFGPMLGCAPMPSPSPAP